MIFGGLTSYAMEESSTLWNTYIDFVENISTDPSSQCIVYTYYVGGQFGVQSLISNNRAVEFPPALDGFRVIPNITTSARVRTVANLTAELSGGQPIGIQ